MKRFLIIILIIITAGLIMSGCSPEFFGALPGNNESYSSSSDINYSEGEMIVVLENNQPMQEISVDKKKEVMNEELSTQRQYLKSHGFKIDNILSNSQSIESKVELSTKIKEKILEDIGYINLVDYTDKDYKNFNEAKNEVKSLLENKGYKVKYIIRNYKIKKVDSTYSGVSKQDNLKKMHSDQEWNYEMIRAPEAWEGVRGNEDVKIAIVDTGIDVDHPYLENFVDVDSGVNILALRDVEDQDREKLDDNNVDDKDGHGTHVAGTISSYDKVSGIMKEASLIPIKVFPDPGQENVEGDFYDLLNAVIYATETGVDVINMSVGGELPKNNLEVDKFIADFDANLNIAREEGVIIITAAGNNGESIEGSDYIFYPASSPYTIAVGAVEENKQKADFSNDGVGLDVMAPGVEILSTAPIDLDHTNYEDLRHPEDEYLMYMSGTSMAAPHVAGVAGLMRSANPNMTVEDIEYMLKDAAKDMGNEEEYGEGIVDAYKSIRNRVKTPYF
ncbi:MAG: S8 family peptidase [Bacillota bacterium]